MVRVLWWRKRAASSPASAGPPSTSTIATPTASLSPAVTMSPMPPAQDPFYDDGSSFSVDVKAFGSVENLEGRVTMSRPGDDNNNKKKNKKRDLIIQESPIDSIEKESIRDTTEESSSPPLMPDVNPRTEDEFLGTMDKILATMSDLEDDFDHMDSVSENSVVEETEQRRELLTDFDQEGFGEIPWPDFRKAISHPEFIAAVDVHKRQRLEAKALSPTTTAITFQDFVNLMSDKRTRSFKCAVHHRDRQVSSENDFHLLLEEPPLFTRMVKLIAEEFLTEDRDRKYYADHYKCCPPPVFVLAVTLTQISVFCYYVFISETMKFGGPVPIDSPFVYRPDKREEIWRFIFYSFLHASWVHLTFNVIVQLLVGLPLEMVHGSARIGTVYLAGVLAGSLGTSVFDSNVFLVGASGGVYALLAAHLANVLINYNNMQFGVLRLLGVIFIASADVGYAIYDRYAQHSSGLPVSYVAHLMGAVAGLTLGLVVLKNFEQRLHEQLLWWIALGVYAACMLFAILFNVFHSYPYNGVIQSL